MSGSSFAFIHFLDCKWWQSHPFSTYYDGELLHFMILPRSGLTGRIDQLAQKKRLRVLIDGPYGTVPNLGSFETVVFIVGGIGITAVLDSVRTLLLKDPQKEVHVHWAVRGASYLQMVDYLVGLLPGRVLLTIYISTSRMMNSVESINNSVGSYSSKSIKRYTIDLHYCLLNSRLCVREIVSSLIYQCERGSIVFVTCGPKGMSAEAVGAIRDAIMSSVNYIELYDHTYSW